jgi:acyl carrier protein
MGNDTEQEAGSGDMQRVIDVIVKIGNLTAIGPDDDFYDAGFSSIRALVLVTELEATFDVTIPDDSFSAARTPRALHTIIRGLIQ